MPSSNHRRNIYLGVFLRIAVGFAALAVLLNIPVAQAYFVTGVLGVLASSFFFCAPLPFVEERRHLGFVPPFW